MTGPPPRVLLLFAALVMSVYLLIPPRTWRDIHSFTILSERPLVEQVDDGCRSWAVGCPPPTDLDALSSPPPPVHAAPPPTPGCNAQGECTVETLVRRHAVDNTVVVTFGNQKQAIFTENWVYHLRRLGVGGLLVGMMNEQPSEPRYVQFATKLRALGVGVYTVNSAEVARQPQGGRWFHVLPLLRTGARVLLSDSDVTWLRDPRPYFVRLEAAHPLLDFTVSSDAQGGTDGRRLRARAPATAPGRRLREKKRRRGRRGRRSGSRGDEGDDLPKMDDESRAVGLSGIAGAVSSTSDDLDIEAFGHCGGPSLNIGIMHFPPGRRPGTLLAMEEAVAHLAFEGNLGRVDQGPINFRWRFGAGKMGQPGAFRWKRPLFPVRDESGSRLCGFCNGSSVGIAC